jgi:alpha/beta superfamily hydrolase
MATSESLDIPGPAGRLEAILMHPESEPVAAGVVCHAHPLHGGMMHFKVIFRAAKALQENGVAALRFNFRGVGRSEGAHDGGRGERDDVRAALEFAAARFGALPLILGGFSFGAAMALHAAAADARARALFVLGLPVTQMKDLAVLSAVSVPRLFVQGQHDEFGDGERVRGLVEPLPPPRELRLIANSDHFFAGHLDELQHELARWVLGRPWSAAA